MKKFNLFLAIRSKKNSSKIELLNKTSSWKNIYLLNQEIQYQIYKNEIFQKNNLHNNFEKIIKLSLLVELNIIYSFLNELALNIEKNSRQKAIINYLDFIRNQQMIKYCFFYFFNKKNKKLTLPSSLKKNIHFLFLGKRVSPLLLWLGEANQTEGKKDKKQRKQSMQKKTKEARKYYFSKSQNRVNSKKSLKIKNLNLENPNKKNITLNKTKIVHNLMSLKFSNGCRNTKSLIKKLKMNKKSNFLLKNLFYKNWFLKFLEPHLKSSLYFKNIFVDELNQNNVKSTIFWFIQKIFISIYLQPKFILILTIVLKRKNIDLLAKKYLDSSPKELIKNNWLKKNQLSSSVIIKTFFKNTKSRLTYLKSFFLNYKIGSKECNIKINYSLISSAKIKKYSIKMLKFIKLFFNIKKNFINKLKKTHRSYCFNNLLINYFSYVNIIFLKLELIKENDLKFQPKLTLFFEKPLKIRYQIFENKAMINNNLISYKKFLEIFYKLSFLKNEKNNFLLNVLLFNTEKTFIDYLLSKTNYYIKNLISQQCIDINYLSKVDLKKINVIKNIIFLLYISKTDLLNKKNLFFPLHPSKNLFFQLRKPFIIFLYKNITFCIFYNKSNTYLKKNYIIKLIIQIKQSNSLKKELFQEVNFSKIKYRQEFKLDKSVKSKINNKREAFNKFFSNYYSLILKIKMKSYQNIFNQFYLFYGEDLLLFQKKSTIFYNYKNTFIDLIYRQKISIKKNKLYHTIFTLNKKKSGFIFYGFYIFQKLKSNKLMSLKKIDQLDINLQTSKRIDVNKETLFNKKIIYNLVDLKYIKTYVIPSKKNLKNHLGQIKYIIFKSQGNTQERLINKISPIINKWCNYYKSIYIQRILNNCNFFLMKIIWKWCLKRHHDKNNSWIKDKYFYSLNSQKAVFATKKSVYFDFLKNQKSIESNKSIYFKTHFKITQDYKNTFYKKNLQKSIKNIFIVLPTYK
jgi:hypothetical protein